MGLVPSDQARSAGWIDNGVLVYGPRKAGTTLFQNLLDGGEELLAYPAELKLKYFSRKWTPTKTASVYLDHSRVPEVQSDRLSIEAYRAAWRDLVAARQRHQVGDLIRFDAWSLANAMDRLPSRLALWCAKEVGGGKEDVVAYWRKLFPRSKVLFIVREPRSVVRAILHDRHKKNRPPDRREIERQVRDVFRTLQRQARYLDDPAVHFAVFERLTADVAGEMQRVAAFLGIAWDSVFTRPTLFAESVVVRTASRSSKEVFRSDTTWRDGLSDAEQANLDRAVERARASGRALDYDALVARIDARQPSPLQLAV